MMPSYPPYNSLDLAKIMNFREWTAYTVILTKKSSDVIQDLLAYFLLLTKTEREHQIATGSGTTHCLE